MLVNLKRTPEGAQGNYEKNMGAYYCDSQENATLGIKNLRRGFKNQCICFFWSTQSIFKRNTLSMRNEKIPFQLKNTKINLKTQPEMKKVSEETRKEEEHPILKDMSSPSFYSDSFGESIFFLDFLQ